LASKKSAAYTVAEVAERLGTSLVFTYEAIHRGEIPSFRMGRKIIIPRVPFDEMMATARRPGSALPSTTETSLPFKRNAAKPRPEALHLKRTKVAKHRPGELKERAPT
jgi:excisionase family DNA binding protein